MKIKCVLKNGAGMPEYKSAGAAGADLCACIDENIVIKPNERSLVPTGVFVEIEEGYEMQLRPRSGLALKHGITLLNSPATIDSDYRGEIKVILVNLGNEPFIVKNGERIAQAVIAQAVRARFLEVSSLSETERNDSGFGSTGI